MKAGTYQIVPAGSIVIHGGMTLKEFADAMERAKATNTEPPIDAAPLIDRLNRRIDLLEKLLGPLTGPEKK
jgi:hypothetical protein